MDDDYNCIVTSSFESIFAPPIGGNRAVLERADFYFADDDYLVWPQPYDPSLPHLPFIRRYEVDILDPEQRFLWSLPARADFKLLDSQSYTGLGLLNKSKLGQLQSFYKSLIIKMHENDCHLPSRNSGHHLHARSLITESNTMLQRLQYLPMGFCSVCRTVRAAQRVLLELEAYIDYYTAYHHASPASGQSPTVFPRIGSFLSQIRELEIFQRFAIPHWLILPHEHALHCRINEVTIMRFPQDCGLSTDPISSSASPIFVGPTADRKKYEAIRKFGHNCIRFPDPFHCKAIPEPIVSVLGPVRSMPGSSHRALTHKQRMKLFASDRKPIQSFKLRCN